jgi:hypothetical protein
MAWIRTLSIFFSAPALAAILSLVGCRNTGGASNCGKVSAFGAGGVPYDGAGGFVSFVVQERRLNGPLAPGSATSSSTVAEKLCTAVFDFNRPERNGTKPIRLWTAAHCVGRSLENVESLSLEVFSNGFYTTVPVSFEYLERRKAAGDFLAQRGIRDESWRTLFAWYLSLEEPSSDNPPCRILPGKPRPPQVVGTQNLCASWSDLLSLEVTLPAPEFTALRRRIFSKGIPTSFGVVDSFIQQHDKLALLRREAAVAEAVDAYHLCRETPWDARANDTSGMKCTLDQEWGLKEVLTKFALPDGRNALDEAARNGVVNSRTKFGRLLSDRYGAELQTMRGMWRTRAAEVMAKPSSVVLLTNLVPEARFSLFDLPGVGVARSNVVVEDYGFRVVQKKSAFNVAFGKTDSGSVFTWRDKVPMVVLQSVDNEETSGGAAVARLPRRGSTTTPASNVGSDGGGQGDSSGAAQTGSPDPCISSK